MARMAKAADNSPQEHSSEADPSIRLIHLARILGRAAAREFMASQSNETENRSVASRLEINDER